MRYASIVLINNINKMRIYAEFPITDYHFFFKYNNIKNREFALFVNYIIPNFVWIYSNNEFV